MTNETENLYRIKKDVEEKDEPTRKRELKKHLVLFETDDGPIVTYDEFTGRKPIEEEPTEAIAEQPAEPETDNPALYPLYKRINNIEETKDELAGYTQVIVKFVDYSKNEATA